MAKERFKTVHETDSEINIGVKSVVDFSKDWLIVLREKNLADWSNSVIGIANNREKALEMIRGYYGEDAEIGEPRIIEDSGLNFDVSVIVKDEMWGGNYVVTGFDFKINEL